MPEVDAVAEFKEGLALLRNNYARKATEYFTRALELDKANSELVSLCPVPGLSLARRGRNFVAEVADYTPTRDIKVRFVFARCNNPRCD